MAATQYKNHVSNPANQPFNLNGRRNLTKKRSWWSTLSPTYWRTATKGKSSGNQKPKAAE